MKPKFFCSKLYSMAWQSERFVILNENGFLIDDCEGSGYTTKEKALYAYKYKTSGKVSKNGKPVVLHTKVKSMLDKLDGADINVVRTILENNSEPFEEVEAKYFPKLKRKECATNDQ